MKLKYYLLFVPILIVYLIGMFNDVMEVDASQYAAMSREMMETGNYVQLYDRGIDYLDKPPLLFWVSALSFKLFGISNFSYKLPSVLFSLLGIFATLHLGKRLYGERTGFYAALILTSSQAWFLMNHDVRTDTILAACTIFGIWQLFVFMDKQRLIHLLGGSLGIAGAMLTKGPIGVMVPALSIGTYLLVKRDWKNLFNWKWVLVPLIVVILISPFLYGLYQQYDLHPGKIIDGRPIKSGIQFYLWTQSFGRITGENFWKDDTTMLFFTHTFLWAFLPWCVLFVVTLWKDTQQLIISRFKMVNAEVALTWGGFVFPFIAFSLSHYKLPHYIFIIFPLAAIATARFVDQLINGNSKATQNTFKWIQLFVALVVYALGALLCTWAFPLYNIVYWAIFVVGAGFTLYFFLQGKNGFETIVLPSLIGIIVLNFLLNIHFYPALSHFASSNKAARIIRSMREEKSLRSLNAKPYGLDAYSLRTIQHYPSLSKLISDNKGNTIWIFTDEKGHNEIVNSGLKIIEDKEFEQFHISALSIPFLNPTTRKKEIGHTYLIKLDVAKHPQRVIIFMIDGFGEDYYAASSMPTLKIIEREGIFKIVKSVMPTVTNTNNASISTGTFPDAHGITGNSFFDSTKDMEEYMEDSSLVLTPTIFERAKKFGVKSMMFSSKKKTISLLSRGALLALSPETASNEWIQKLGKPPEIYSCEVNYWLMEAALYNLKKHPEIGCIYIHTTDYPMHTWAPEDEESREHLLKLDSYISEFIKVAPDAAILITADHSVHHKSKCWDLAKACANRGTPIQIAISAERDKYPKHHRGFGGTSYAYLRQPADLKKVKEQLLKLNGVDKVLTREEAVATYHLKADRIGDLVVLGDIDTVFGDLDSEYEILPKGYRSHGSAYETSIPLFLFNAEGAPPRGYFKYNFDLARWLFQN